MHCQYFIDVATLIDMQLLISYPCQKPSVSIAKNPAKTPQKPAKNPLKILQLNNCYTKNILCFNNKLTKNN
jgi:hypothetical protein